MDVSLPLGARRRYQISLRQGAAASRECAGRQSARQGARRLRRQVSRPHGGPGLVRRLQRGHRAADRGRALDMLGLLDTHLASTPRICSAAGLPSAISGCGARSTKCGPIRPRAPSSAAARRMCSIGCTACSGRRPRRVRGLVHAGADPDADPDQAGRKRNSCRGHAPTRRRLRKTKRIQRHARRQDLDPEAAKISRAIARHAARPKYAAVADKAALDPVLDAAGCLAGLRG